jgi:ribosomal-protein-alanine N-acetyltransferase
LSESGACTSSPRAEAPRLVVERATALDLEALIDIERRSYSHPWTRRNFEGELGAGERSVFLVLRNPLEAGGKDRGIRGYCAFQVVVDEMHLLNLTVAPKALRLGHGRFLLRLALSLAAGRGARHAYLEVRAGNVPARALYAAAGFAEAGRRRGYYRQPAEDAVVLRRIL